MTTIREIDKIAEETEMASLEEELKLARQAKAAIEAGRTMATIDVLRKATRMATTQKTGFSGDGPLNDARDNIGLALPSYTAEDRNPTQDEIDKARRAIEEWIRHLG
jgi:hypothetical protein